MKVGLRIDGKAEVVQIEDAEKAPSDPAELIALIRTRINAPHATVLVEIK